jgi:hypothetical protein
MGILLFAAFAVAADAASANALVPQIYKDKLKFAAAVTLPEKVHAVVPANWVAQRVPEGVWEPPEDYALGRGSEFRVGYACGPGCKPPDDWPAELEEQLLKPLHGWSWRVLREEKSAQLRFVTSRSPGGVVEIVLAHFKPTEGKALYCHVRLEPQGGGMGQDPVVEKMVPAFEEACLALKP